MPFWIFALLWVATTILSFILRKALAPKVAKRGPGEIQQPISEQGYPIPVAYGTVRLKGPNVIGSWNQYASPQNQGMYHYWANMHLALCHGPIDRFRRVWAGDFLASVAIKFRRSGNNAAKNKAGLQNMPTAISRWPEAEPALNTWYVVAESTISWKPSDNAFRSAVLQSTPISIIKPNEIAKPGWFVRFVKNKRMVIADPNSSIIQWVEREIPYPADPWPNPTSLFNNAAAHNYMTNRHWRFEVVQPDVGDTIYDGGTYKTWNGVAWVIDGNTATYLVGRVDANSSKRDEEQCLLGWAGFHHGTIGAPEDKFLAARRQESGFSYGGLVHMTLHGNAWGDWNPDENSAALWGASGQILPVSVEIERCPNPFGWPSFGTGNAAWPSNTLTGGDMGDDLPSGRNAQTAYDANPAVIIYDLLTNTTYGLGVPAANIDTQSFDEAGRLLGYEKLGMSMLIDQQGEFDDVVADILKTIDGVFYCDPATGKFTLRLIREPVDPTVASQIGLTSGFYTNDNPPTFTEDDIIGDPEYTRGSWGDVANEVRVQYTSRNDDYANKVVYISDPANRMAQGETVSVQNVYPGITNGDLALRLAYRDLRSIGYPRARLKIVLNKKAWDLRPGDVFVLSYPTLGIVSMGFRIGEIRYSDMGDGRVEIQAIEDVFSLPDTIYTEPGTTWVDPASVDPQPPAAVRMWEPPYPMMATVPGTRRGMSVLAVRGDQYTTGGELWGAVEGLPLQRVGVISYTASAVLTNTLGWTERESEIPLQGAVDFAQFQAKGTAQEGLNLALVGEELIAFDTIGVDGLGNPKLVGCLRGAMDTIPRPHNNGDRVWLVRVPLPMAQTDNPTDDRVELARVVAGNAKRLLDPYTQPTYQGGTVSRQERPLVPGRFRVEASDLATTMTDRILCGDLDVEWEKRNRLTQAPGVVAQDADSVAPEAGQNSRLRIQQGVGLLFDIYYGYPQKLLQPGVQYRFPGWGGVVTNSPFSVAVDSSGANRTFYRLPTGISAYLDTLTQIVYGVTESQWVYADMALGRVRAISQDSSPELWPIYRMDWMRDGSDLYLVLADLRGSVPEAELVNSPTVTERAVTPQEIVNLGAVGPVQVEVDAVRDGLGSLEQRESGLVFPAGWGMAWGLHWGGDGT